MIEFTKNELLRIKLALRGSQDDSEKIIILKKIKIMLKDLEVLEPKQTPDYLISGNYICKIVKLKFTDSFTQSVEHE